MIINLCLETVTDFLKHSRFLTLNIDIFVHYVSAFYARNNLR